MPADKSLNELLLEKLCEDSPEHERAAEAIRQYIRSRIAYYDTVIRPWRKAFLAATGAPMAHYPIRPDSEPAQLRKEYDMTGAEAINKAHENFRVADKFQREAEDLIYNAVESSRADDVVINDQLREKIEELYGCAAAHRSSALDYLRGDFSSAPA